MPAKKMGCVRTIAAVVFTSIVAPVLANVLAHEVTTWQQTLSFVLGVNQPAEWNQPAVEEGVRQPHAGAWLDRPIPVEAPAPGRRGERSNAVWGR
jgi:hypothetical protein